MSRKAAVQPSAVDDFLRGRLLVSIQELADACGVSYDYVYLEIQRGHLERWGRHTATRITADSIRRWLAEGVTVSKAARRHSPSVTTEGTECVTGPTPAHAPETERAGAPTPAQKENQC